MSVENPIPSAVAPGAVPWSKVFLFGFLGFLATALIWFGVRAFTGIFEVLNLRVFVGAIAMVPAFGGVVFASGDSKAISVSTVAAVFGIAAILAGEGLATVVTGVPIPWTKFNLIFLGVAAVLPFVWHTKR